jgi:DNA modification methylase
MKNALYFGDNLDILREHIKDETIDLVYLDPPFNSNANYNVLFTSPKGHASHAQIEAFDDTWHWGDEAEKEFNELLHQSNTNVAEMMQSLRRFLGENDMMAYLTMMANRLLELHRVLKPTGSLYLHCDPTASHYLKLVLDGVFGHASFKNEIIWKRTTAHSDAKQGSSHFGRVHDTLLFYAMSPAQMQWNAQWKPHDEGYIISHYSTTDADGRHFMWDNLTGPGGAAKGNPYYEVLGVPGFWRYSRERMAKLIADGMVAIPPGGNKPRLKRYLDEQKGTPIADLWDDIFPINSQAMERLGYPTQKPLALLERIINASSNEGDIVLDPFCGCGTAVHAAEKLRRNWIGIDITHLAITLIEKRLRNAFPGIKFEVHGTPKDIGGARDLAARDKYQFQWWACSLVDAAPYQGKKKGADSGIDGIIYFHDEEGAPAQKIIVSVKGGENISVPMIRDLGHVVQREKAAIGLLVSLTEPTKPMQVEATKAGYYESPQTKRNFPRLQILTIADLLDGKARPLYPNIESGGVTFKKAKVESKQDQKKLF